MAIARKISTQKENITENSARDIHNFVADQKQKTCWMCMGTGKWHMYPFCKALLFWAGLNFN